MAWMSDYIPQKSMGVITYLEYQKSHETLVFESWFHLWR